MDWAWSYIPPALEKHTGSISGMIQAMGTKYDIWHTECQTAMCNEYVS
jgi:hypothetical protein